MADIQAKNLRKLLNFCQRLYLENSVMKRLLNNCVGFEWSYFDEGVSDPVEIEKARKKFETLLELAAKNEAIESQLQIVEQDKPEDD